MITYWDPASQKLVLAKICQIFIRFLLFLPKICKILQNEPHNLAEWWLIYLKIRLSGGFFT